MVPLDVFREQPVLTGGRVRLDPLDGENGAALVDDDVEMDPVVRRLTGTHQRFTPEGLRECTGVDAGPVPVPRPVPASFPPHRLRMT